MWLAERVWEPQLPRVLREAGVEYVLVDDRTSPWPASTPTTLGGYYLTEEQGATVARVPDQPAAALPHPVRGPAESVAVPRERRGAGAVTMVDDGEKFGVWPGTYRHVYEEGWLDRFFDALRATPWLRVSTFSRFLDTEPAGRPRLPADRRVHRDGRVGPAAAAAAELHDARARLAALPDGERLSRLLRGGFLRNFLVKYPEVGDAYWKMLRLSRRVARGPHRAPARSAVLAGPRAALARPGQRRLLARRVRRLLSAAPPPGGEVGADRLRAPARGPGQAAGTRLRAGRRQRRRGGRGGGAHAVAGLTLSPARGGSLTELLWLGGEMDTADVLTRRPEAYHRQVAERPTDAGADEVRTIHAAPAVKEAGLTALLRYDRFRRASLLDGLFPPEGELDPLDPWDAARLVIGERPLDHEVKTSPREVALHCSRSAPTACRSRCRSRWWRSPTMPR